MFYQLRSFSPSASDAEISYQSGVLLGVFTLAQVFTGILWGRLADHPSFGRKTVLIICLTGQGLSCMGVAFSRSFTSAVVWRCLGGAVNATVGAARTALAECTEKKYHVKTFLLLPLAWNLANIFGPILGGLLSDPFLNYPSLFGENSTFGGTTGVQWFKAFPYALPNLMCSLVLFGDAALLWLGLRETLVSRRYHRDRGIEFAEHIRYRVSSTVFQRFGYSALNQSQTSDAPDTIDDFDTLTSTQMTQLAPHKEMPQAQPQPPRPSEPAKQVPPFHQALTSNVLLVLSTVAFMDFQMGGFASLWTVFLSSARRTPNDPVVLPLAFTGGLGFSPSGIGFAMSILGFVGITLQFTLYPSINARFGLLRSFRWSLFSFPVAYFVTPYLSLLVNHPAILYCGIVIVVLLQIGPRTFAVPGSVLLINNSSPSPALLGTIHGMGAATSSAFRTVGPIVAGHWYSQGLDKGMVGEAWWLLALVSLVGCAPSFWVRDGSK